MEKAGWDTIPNPAFSYAFIERGKDPKKRKGKDGKSLRKPLSLFLKPCYTRGIWKVFQKGSLYRRSECIETDERLQLDPGRVLWMEPAGRGQNPGR